MALKIIHDGVDRISELPQGILRHIQSFLSIKEVAQSSVLSETWKQVSIAPIILEKQVSIAPIILEFDETFFPVDLWHKFRTEDVVFWEHYELEKKKDGEIQRALAKINQLFDAMDRILAPFGKQKLGINRFKLDIHLNELDWSSRVDQWIQQVVDSNVRELFIHIEPYQLRYNMLDDDDDDDENMLYRLYTLPHCILVAKSVVTLSIIGSCKFEFLPADFKLNLSSVKNLILHRVFLNDDALHKIIVGCRLVEDLTIHECEGFKNLRVPISLVNLRRLSVAGIGYKQIYHSKPEIVCVEALNIVDIEFRDLQSLQKFDIHSYKDLKSMILDSVKADKWREYYCYPSLENCTIHSCEGLETLKIKSHRLKYLVISGCHQLEGIELDTPNLSRFDYLNSDNVRLSWMGTPPALCSVFLRLYFFGQHPREDDKDPNRLPNWYLKRIEFLAKFNDRCRKLDLSCFDDKGNISGLIFPNELRQRLPPPLPDLKELTVRLNSRRVKHHSEELINSIHWMSPNSKKKFNFF